MKSNIKSINAIEILDSRGNPTVEVDVFSRKRDFWVELLSLLALPLASIRGSRIERWW